MIHAAPAWVSGAPFVQLTALTSLLEGDIVRILSRLEELAKQVRAAARLLGDARLVQTVDSLLASIKRDVVSAPSLYLDGAANNIA